MQKNSLNNIGKDCIFLFLLGRLNNNLEMIKKGNDLLNQLCDNLQNGELNIGFQTGISGIGWLIEWLNQNKLLEKSDTDEILEDIDTYLYKSTLYSSNISKFSEEYLGTTLYFLIRLKSNNKNKKINYGKLGIPPCLLKLSDILILDISKLEERIQYGDMFSPLELEEIIQKIFILLKLSGVNSIAIETAINFAFLFSEYLLKNKLINYNNYFLIIVCLSFKDYKRYHLEKKIKWNLNKRFMSDDQEIILQKKTITLYKLLNKKNIVHLTKKHIKEKEQTKSDWVYLIDNIKYGNFKTQWLEELVIFLGL